MIVPYGTLLLDFVSFLFLSFNLDSIDSGPQFYVSSKSRESTMSRKFRNSSTWTFQSSIQTCNLLVTNAMLYQLGLPSLLNRKFSEDPKSMKLGQKKKIAVFGAPRLKKVGSVGRQLLFFFFPFPIRKVLLAHAFW